MRPILLVLLLATPAGAEEARLDCALADEGTFAVGLGLPGEFGPVHCVDAAGTDTKGLGEMATCAPQGGWGITGEEGVLAAVTANPAEAARTDAPRFFARLGPSEFVASASAGPGIPLALEVGGPTFWRMRLALGSGEGIVVTQDGEQAVTCAAG